jgi:hypothetical protein
MGIIRIDAELTPTYPFVGNTSYSFITMPTVDLTISSFGGIDLATIPGVYSLINITTNWLLAQYTAPNEYVYDMRRVMCPSCYEKEPTVQEIILEAIKNTVHTWNEAGHKAQLLLENVRKTFSLGIHTLAWFLNPNRKGERPQIDGPHASSSGGHHRGYAGSRSSGGSMFHRHGREDYGDRASASKTRRGRRHYLRESAYYLMASAWHAGVAVEESIEEVLDRIVDVGIQAGHALLGGGGLKGDGSEEDREDYDVNGAI